MSTPAAASAPGLSPRSRVGLAALVVATLVLAIARYAPPAPRGADTTPVAEFSAARAASVRRALLAENAPHPVGSAANARVEAAIVRELARVGYTPAVQTGWACGAYGACASVRNVVARLAGRGGRDAPGAVLLAAHYDSVGAGPGASDDGAGTAAVLEIARALRAGPAVGRDVILLLDDGEESGLLGAHLFARAHPWAREVRAVVNLEARGSSGPAAMFETGRGNAALARVIARALPRPVTSSLFYELYRQLPNDTDFTVFRARGAQGANFAFTSGFAHYHTPLDDLAHGSEASLQHLGASGLAMTRALATHAFEAPTDAVWFDVLALFVVAWPARFTSPLALLALALFAVATVRLARRGAVRARAVALGVLALPFALVLATALSVAAAAALRAAGATPAPWVAHPAAAVGAVVALALGALAVVCFAIGRHAGAWGVWLGVHAWPVAASVTVASVAPAVSHVVLVPALAAGLAGVVASGRAGPTRRGLALAVVAPAVVTACVWAPLLRALPDMIGVLFLAAYAPAAVMPLAPLAPLAAGPGRRAALAAAAGALALALACALTAVLAPAYTAESPQRLNLYYHCDGDTGAARWVADTSWGGTAFGAVPERVLRAGRFDPHPRRAFAWHRGAAHDAPAPALAVPPPELSVLASEPAPGGGRRVRLRVRSLRGALRTTLALSASASIAWARVQGVDASVPEARDDGGFRAIVCATTPAEGAEFELEFADGQRVEAHVFDATPGLPPEAGAITHARGATAVPFQEGDQTIASRRVEL